MNAEPEADAISLRMFVDSLRACSDPTKRRAADVIERLLNSFSETPKWLPIETAPKDGTRILASGMGVEGWPRALWDDAAPRVRGIEVIRWVEGWYDDFEEVSPGSFKKVPKCSYAHWGPNPQQFRPTHWMPLPEAPK